MFKEFKTFAMRGNVLDLAVGVIIGAAFGKIVTSFVSDVLMPPIGLLLGKVDFSNLFIDLSGQHYATMAEAKAAGAATLNYGLFVNNIIDFLLVAFAVFCLINAKRIIWNFEKSSLGRPLSETPPLKWRILLALLFLIASAFMAFTAYILLGDTLLGVALAL